MFPYNEEIVPECEGCNRVLYSVVVRKNICVCYTIPKTQWWFGFICDRATHHPQNPPLEDPIKEP
jgi:hypothetical protein